MKRDNRHKPGDSTQTYEIGYRLPMDSFEKVYLVTALICFISLVSYCAIKHRPIDRYDILVFVLYSTATGLVISFIRLLFSVRMVITSRRHVEMPFEDDDGRHRKTPDIIMNTNNDPFRRDK